MSTATVAHTVPLTRLALVRRDPEGHEEDRADGPALAALLLGVRHPDRVRLFDAEAIAADVNGLAWLVNALAVCDDTPAHFEAALMFVTHALRSLAPRIAAFEQSRPVVPADCYTVLIAPEGAR